jgi:hypothetical protein
MCCFVIFVPFVAGFFVIFVPFVANRLRVLGGDRHVRDTTTSSLPGSPRTFTLKRSSGRGGGPDTTFPARSYSPL